MKIIQKIVKDKTSPYFYLQHSVRINHKVKKYETYLGKSIPSNISELENELFKTIRFDKYSAKLLAIKQSYQSNFSSFPRSVLDKEHENFIIEFTFNTQKIEGSTLSLRETALLLNNGVTPSNKPVADVIEAELHKQLTKSILALKQEINLDTILQWHHKLFSSTKNDIAGKIRTHGVKISGSKFLPPSPVELQSLLEDFFDWFESNKELLDPVELAGLAHLKFVTIHPFVDGNGRLSRLLMNYILYQHGFPMLDIKYSKRLSYYRALEKSQVSEQGHYFLDWFLSYYCSSYNK